MHGRHKPVVWCVVGSAVQDASAVVQAVVRDGRCACIVCAAGATSHGIGSSALSIRIGAQAGAVCGQNATRQAAVVEAWRHGHAQVVVRSAVQVAGGGGAAVQRNDVAGVV